jgi:hypothetical protein
MHIRSLVVLVVQLVSFVMLFMGTTLEIPKLFG